MSSLVQTTTKDGLLLQGYFSDESPKKVVLHIHGFEGNFYENTFVQVMANHLRNKSISFLTVNTRGCEKIKDFNTVDGKIKTIGARYELLEDSAKDIDAWIEFLSGRGYEKIVLQGHSLGTMKAVRYLREGKHTDKVEKLILLSPFDKKGALEKYTKTPITELIVKAQKMIDEGKGDEMITPEFDEIVVSYKTYVSWYKQDDLGRMYEFCSPDYDFPALRAISIPTKVIVGSKDEFFHLSNPDHPEEALGLMEKHIPNCQTKLIGGANHGYRGYEQVLAEEIGDFAGN
jgi:pimeloyl-ACP methyl ester carboxylesterase